MSIVDFIQEAGAVAAALASIAAVLWAVVRFAVLKPLDKRIKEATQPIQPGYRNGGESLADVSNKVSQLTDRFDRLEEAHQVQEQRHMQVIEHLLELQKPRRTTRRKQQDTKGE
jgi:hypothetical protein